MTKKDTKKFLEEHVSMNTFLLLKNYEKWGILSRTFKLKEHDQALQALLKGEGQFSSYTEEERLFVESRYYVELLERLCLLIEDYCIILHGLWNDLRKFPQSLLGQPSPKSILRKFNRSRWHTLLRSASAVF